MTKTPINKIRRLEIKEIVYQALVHGGSANIPIEIKKISKSYKNIRVIPFSVQMERRNMTLQEVYAQCETGDACADYYANVNKYIIYYNDVVKWQYINSNRYRWSIAHELGHILLGHHIKYEKTRIFRSELSESEYDYLEAEADYFAQLILVPHAALWEHGNVSRNLIYNFCKISWPASWIRYSEYKEWHKNIGKDDYDRRIHAFFFAFLNTKTCITCNATLVQRNGNYCPICGSKNTLQWGDGNMSKFKTYSVNENGRLEECIKCHNDELIGGYCHICGSPVENYCADAVASYDYPNKCNNLKPLPSNARFCHICGGESTFNQKGILIDWSQELRQIEEAQHATEALFMNIPDGIDEELPFDTEASHSNNTNTSSSDDLLGFSDIFDGIDEELPFN